MNAPSPVPIPLDVVIPIHNNLQYLAAAVDSALSQDGPDVRVTVVDDGSDEPVVDEVRSWNNDRVKVLRHEECRGIGAARNTGAHAGEREWLAFLDADDCWPEDRTRSLLAALDGSPDAVAFGHILNFPAGDPTPDHTLLTMAEIAELPVATCAGGMLLRRKTFEQIGAFDEHLAVGEFIEWMMRARTFGVDEFVTSRVTLLRGIHSESTTRNTELYTDYLEVVARVRAASASRVESGTS